MDLWLRCLQEECCDRCFHSIRALTGQRSALREDSYHSRLHGFFLFFFLKSQGGSEMSCSLPLLGAFGLKVISAAFFTPPDT